MGEYLIAQATELRQELDFKELPSSTSLLTSFFLFAAHGNLNQPQRAMFYLRQAISIAVMLGLHDEHTYAELTSSEAEQHRRIYWLLFITERYVETKS